jgi:putative SOS response-associated peptidase YedK
MTRINGHPTHDKAMPVMLLTAADIEQWLTGSAEEALALQKPASDKTVVVLPEKKKAA